MSFDFRVRLDSTSCIRKPINLIQISAKAETYMSRRKKKPLKQIILVGPNNKISPLLAHSFLYPHPTHHTPLLLIRRNCRSKEKDKNTLDLKEAISCDYSNRNLDQQGNRWSCQAGLSFNASSAQWTKIVNAFTISKY